MHAITYSFMRFFIGLVLCFFIVQPSSYAAALKTASFTPPNLNEPTQVDLYFYLEDISNINLTDSTVDITAGLIFKWNDPRLAFDPAENDDRKQKFIAGPYATKYLEKIWHPWFEISGERGLHVGTVQSIAIFANGNVEVMHKFYSSPQFSNELRSYPFGSMTLRIAVTPIGSDINEMSLVAKDVWPSTVKDLKSVTHGNWSPIEVQSAIKTVYRDDLPGISFQQLEMLVVVEHDFIDSLHKIFLPLLVVALASFALLWLNLVALPAYSSPRISGYLTLILTVIALKLSLRGELPILSYGTLTDGLYNLTIIMLLIGLLFSCAVAAYVTAGRADIALKIHRRLRLIYPIVYCLAILINTWIFL